jgi:hypothetical protein
VTAGVVYPLATNAGEPDARTLVDLSLFYNRVGWVDAAQFGFVAAHASHRVRGAQVGLVVASANGLVEGAQVSSFLAVARGRVDGAQVAAGANVLAGDLVGAQVSTGLNFAHDVDGFQGSGGLNIANQVSGVQIAPVNVARHAHGLQVGIVNVAEDADAAIGIVSITKDGVHPIAWTSNAGYLNAGVRFATRYVYTTLAVTYGSHERAFDDAGGVVALGFPIRFAPSWELDLEGALTTFRDVNQADAPARESVTPRGLLGYSFAPRLRLFAGGGARIPFGPIVGRIILPEAVAGVQF